MGMTRDEAVRVLTNEFYPGEPVTDALAKDAGMMVDAWAKLGMLKLAGTYPNGDPLPAGKIGKVIWFMNDMGMTAKSPGALESSLRKVGLKIVEA
jgi:hypothetical protein